MRGMWLCRGKMPQPTACQTGNLFKFGSTAKYVTVGHSNAGADEKLIKAAFL